MRPRSPAARERDRDRIQRGIALCGFLALVVALGARGGLAAEQGKTITLGESLNNDQRQELLDYFKAKPDDQVTTVTTADTVEAMEGIFPPGSFSSAYSSTALTCRDLGDGLDVTTRNITVVTPGLYAMALVTAGIGDATLVVAAPNTAAAQGMTALTGVFKTWEIAPCASGDTNKTRQRLALEELTLTVQIGQALVAVGTVDGVQRATNVVLETQKTIVTEKLTDQEEIDRAIAAQERAAGITIPGDLRSQLVSLMTRLANEEIDWSTFSAGWEIKRNADNTRITMTGDGIAIRNARATATAEAAAAMTATARAAANLTATANAAAANMTATANAALTATANAALTATAQARPTVTPTPPPTATPAPFTVTGEVTSIDGDGIAVAEAGDDAPVTYAVGDGATVLRDGESAPIEKVRKGDTVIMVIDGATRSVIELSAEAPAQTLIARLTQFWWMLPLALLLFGILWLKGRQPTEPFVVKHVAA